MNMRSIILVVALGVFGCTKHNPDSCCSTTQECSSLGIDQITGCDSGKACNGMGTCIAAQCETSADCTSVGLPVCSSQLCVATCATDNECVGIAGRPLCAPDGVCVGCIDDASCGASAPVCDTTGRACRRCSEDIECASNVCIDATGTCATVDEVIHVSTFGGDGNDGSVSAPYRTLAFALTKVSATKDVIHFDTAMFTPGGATTITGKRVTIDGIDTTLTPTSGSVMFTIGAQSNVTLERVSIAGGPDAAIVVQTGTALLYNVTIGHSTMADAVQASGGELDIDQGTFSAGFNGYYAFSCSNGGVVHVNRSTFTKVSVATTNCELELRRSTFTNQMDGGLQIANGKVTIENNVFSNGGATPDDSAISNVLAGSTLRFNTFVSYDTSSDRSGVALSCDSSLAVSSNIFAYGQNAVVGCSPKYSLFDDARTMPANQNNVLATLPQIFVSATDFHLSATSPARGKGEPGTDIGVDLEGNPRPAMPDIGAYQAP